MFSTNPSEYEETTITAPSHNLSESKRESSNLSRIGILKFNMALADHTYCASLFIPALHDCCKLEPEELYVDVVDHGFMEEVVIGPTELYSPRIKDEDLDQEITPSTIYNDQVFESAEHAADDDPKLHLQCKVEILDIRETLYCYDCGEWSLTKGDLLCHKNDLLCHKINDSESSINGEQILENEQIPTKEKQLSTCQVEICDIRDELYCYKCGKWSLTADALLCHKIKMHRFFYEVDERVFEQFQAPNQQKHLKKNGNIIKSTAISKDHNKICNETVFEKFQAENKHNDHESQEKKQNGENDRSTVISKGPDKIFDESVFEKFLAENQHLSPHKLQQENQIDKKIKVTARANEIKQNGKGVHKKRKKGFKERKSDSNQIFPCDLCDKSFSKKYTLRIHKLDHRIKPFSCEMCGSLFDNERACAIHVLKHAGIQPNHTSETLQIKREKETREENLNLVLNENFYYDADESIFEQFQANNQQSNQPHNKEYQKEKQEQITKKNPCKKEPQEENHNDKNNLYYDVDESTFEQFQAENQQIHYYPHDNEFQEEHQKKIFICEYCRRHFSRKDNLIQHIQNACCTKSKGTNKNRKVGLKERGSNKLYKCDLCDKSFTRKRTLRIHKRTHQIKPFSCEICGFLFNTERACEIHELKHATAKVDKQSCNVCGRVLNSREELDKHKKSHAKSSLRYICELCGTHFSRKSNLITHIENRCGTVPKSSKRKEKRKKRKIGERGFPCNLCYKSFTRQWCLDVHKHIHERKPFSCEICGQMFENEKACEIHELLRHAGIKPHQCNQCEKAFDCKSSLKIHSDKHRAEKSYCCDSCNRRFKYKGNLVAHKRMFHNPSKLPQKFTCDKCDKTFTCKRYLIKHLRRHYQEWRFACEHCRRPFRLASELESHILNKHTAFRPFECERCALRFATKLGLANHERRHDDKSKKYQCDVCGKKFESKKYQVVHTLRHQGIRNKQFSCETCGKEFEDHSSLKRHKIIHSDERPHSCDICGKSFKLKQSVRLHKIQKHTNIRPFVCDICGSRHKTFGDRTNHMKLHDDNEHWCDHCGRQFTSRNSVARHIFGYCKKSGQKRITKKFGKKISHF